MSPSLYRMEADDIPSVAITDKCIILDLDQTFIATQDNIDSLKTLGILSKPELLSLRSRTYHIVIEDLEVPGIATKYDFWGVTRPHLHEFLLFCFSYFKIVAVWSAGQRPYVEAIVDHIFKDIHPPHVIFTHDDIIYKEKNHIIKPLSKMINSNPLLKKYMTPSNTLVLDDNITTFSENPENGVLIPAYEPALNVNALARDDPSLLQFKYWLLKPDVKNSRDIRIIDKSNIFKTSLDRYKKEVNIGYNFTT